MTVFAKKSTKPRRVSVFIGGVLLCLGILAAVLLSAPRTDVPASWPAQRQVSVGSMGTDGNVRRQPVRLAESVSSNVREDNTHEEDGALGLAWDGPLPPSVMVLPVGGDAFGMAANESVPLAGMPSLGGGAGFPIFLGYSGAAGHSGGTATARQGGGSSRGASGGGRSSSLSRRVVSAASSGSLPVVGSSPSSSGTSGLVGVAVTTPESSGQVPHTVGSVAGLASETAQTDLSPGDAPVQTVSADTQEPGGEVSPVLPVPSPATDPGVADGRCRPTFSPVFLPDPDCSAREASIQPESAEEREGNPDDPLIASEEKAADQQAPASAENSEPENAVGENVVDALDAPWLEGDTELFPLDSGGGDFLVDSGVYSPGNSPGVEEVKRDFRLSDEGILLIEIAGTEPGVDFDLILVSGQANLDSGTLIFAFIDGFVPDPQDILQFLIADGGIVIGDELTLYYGYFDEPYTQNGPKNFPQDLALYIAWDGTLELLQTGANGLSIRRTGVSAAAGSVPLPPTFWLTSLGMLLGIGLKRYWQAG